MDKKERYAVTSLIGLHGDNLEYYYKMQHTEWIYLNSDNVVIDGEICNERMERLFVLSLVKFGNRKLNSVEVCGKCNGSELTEKRFIEYEIDRISKIEGDLLPLGKKLNKEDYLKYLHSLLNNKTLEANQGSTEVTFEQLFKNPQMANLSLDKLKKTFPDLLSDDYSYIKGVKGIFPMFIRVLQNEGFINNYSDKVYKNALNNKINNLNLSNDASEFRKNYVTVTDGNRTDLKLYLSQISH